jgi:signal transduction histidine kinase/ligand-binding sensor domain-containing protein
MDRRQLQRSWPAWLVALAVTAAGPVRAIDPALDLSQYRHTRWLVEDGAPTRIGALAQATNGFLWVGGAQGAYRFDGVTFEHIALTGDRDPGAVALRAMANGDMWIGYADGTIAFYRNGVLHKVGEPGDGYQITRLLDGGDGTLWAVVGHREHNLLRVDHGHWQEVGSRLGVPSEFIIDAIVSGDGALWLATYNHVLTLPKGARQFSTLPIKPSGPATLAEDGQGRIWLTDHAGSRPIADAHTGRLLPAVAPLPVISALTNANSLVDRDDNLWDAPEDGLFRIRISRSAAAAAKSPQPVEFYHIGSGIASEQVRALLEDREGNIWFGSSLGLDRFRAPRVVTEPALVRAPRFGFQLLGASDGAVYVGLMDAVYRIPPGGHPQPLLTHTPETQALCEGRNGSIWVGMEGQLVRILHGVVSRMNMRSPEDFGFTDCAVDGQDRLWLSAEASGLYRWAKGKWSILRPPPGAPHATTIMAGRSGNIIGLFTPNTVRQIDWGGRTKVIMGDADDANALYDGPSGLLVGREQGLSRLKDGRWTLLSDMQSPWLHHITAVTQTPEARAWMMTSSGVVTLPSASLDRAFADPRFRPQARILDQQDGLPNVGSLYDRRGIVRGGDGRLWISTQSGVVWVNPASLKANPTPPPVAITALIAHDRRYRDPTDLSLPKGTPNIEIDFSALSLSIPQRVRFRYQLEGVDSGWVDPGQRRQAFYTNLGPGTYSFHVIAANDDGVWNRTGATMRFTIPPTFLQSGWFMALCALAVAALLWGLYSLRVRQVTRQMRGRLEERLDERERIARELHDTLLQGFQGLMLRIQAIADHVPAARPLIEQALDRGDQVLKEGRDRVRELRVADTKGDLSEALMAVAEDMSAQSDARFCLVVEGKPRACHPVACAEMEAIGEEAIRNAFSHAKAQTIDVTITYLAGEFRLSVRDDGVGMDGDAHPAGHYGLVGMRERAERIGGALAMSSRPGAGTEILLTVPARAAYASRRRKLRAIRS